MSCDDKNDSSARFWICFVMVPRSRAGKQYTATAVVSYLPLISTLLSGQPLPSSSIHRHAYSDIHTG